MLGVEGLLSKGVDGVFLRGREIELLGFCIYRLAGVGLPVFLFYIPCSLFSLYVFKYTRITRCFSSTSEVGEGRV